LRGKLAGHDQFCRRAKTTSANRSAENDFLVAR
jgi:hypothetical protein